jgi:hypothetical protein
LQGTVWPARRGEIAGWLVWNYEDGRSEKVPIVYGEETARFWGSAAQIRDEKDFLIPVWDSHESEQDVGEERWLRIYRQSWQNPLPEVKVATLDFISNRDCSASPFLLAINIQP